MDERELIEFDVEYNLAETFPNRINAAESMRKCSLCGTASQAIPAVDLTVIKSQHAAQPLGHLRLYCRDHLAESRGGSWAGSALGPAGPVCPTCFVAIPTGTLECDTCGWSSD
jgi:hypothetical protein